MSLLRLTDSHSKVIGLQMPQDKEEEATAQGSCDLALRRSGFRLTQLRHHLFSRSECWVSWGFGLLVSQTEIVHK